MNDIINKVEGLKIVWHKFEDGNLTLKLNNGKIKFLHFSEKDKIKIFTENIIQKNKTRNTRVATLFTIYTILSFVGIVLISKYFLILFLIGILSSSILLKQIIEFKTLENNINRLKEFKEKEFLTTY